jgi:hypothetical protein
MPYSPPLIPCVFLFSTYLAPRLKSRQAFLHAVRSLRQETEIEPSSQRASSVQWASLPWSHTHTATTVSFQLASKQQLGKGSTTSIIAQEPSNFEYRPSTAEEARMEEEIRFENIPHQL